MKSILFIVNHLNGGGIEQMLLNIAICLQSNYDVYVLSIYHSNSIYTEKISNYAKISTLDLINIRKYKYISSIYSRLFDCSLIQRLLLKKFINKNNGIYNNIVTFSEGYATKITTQKLKNIKKLVWIHTDILEDIRIKTSPNYISKLSKVYNSFDKTIFVSKFLEEKFKSKLNIDNSICIPNAIDIENIIKKSKHKGLIKKDNNKLQLIAIGRLSYEKGFDRIINSLAKLPEKLKTKCHLTILGQDYGEYNNLNVIINEHKLNKTITLAGFSSNPYATLKDADILLVPSRYEGFGLVIVEAMALDIPTIATMTTGASDILDNGKYGMIIPNEDCAYDDILPKLISHQIELESYKHYFKERLKYYTISRLKSDILNIL